MDRWTDRQDLSVYFKWRCRGLVPGSFFFFLFFLPFSGGLPRVNNRVLLLLLLFFLPFSVGLLMVNTKVFLFFVFFFRPFPAGSLCMAESASVYFKWRFPGLILGFFFFFFPPFFGRLPRVNTRVLLLLLFFPPLTDGLTQAITFLKIKNMANLVKQCKGASQ